MIIREAKEEDIPEILEVLKASLGEVSSKKTEEVWRYKHLKNPFGKSLVLLAIEDGNIIGVRAFMKWNWQFKNQLFNTYRAVDTATHPNYRGRGIFKKLTLQALELGSQKKKDFVFNTPNEQSKPGYIKMGWKEVDKLKIQLILTNPFFTKRLNNKIDAFKGTPSDCVEELTPLLDKHNQELRGNGVFTPKSLKFLQWRYEDNPLQEYNVLKNKTMYIVTYLKKRGRLRELRVAEKLCLNKNAEDQANKWIRLQAKNEKAHIISCEPRKKPPYLLSMDLKLGPVLTFKRINLDEKEYHFLMTIDNWHYSIGDLELF